MILAGDVGGTKVRLALFEEKGIDFVDEQKFISREFPDFASLLNSFLSQKKGEKITCASFGIAGPVHDRKCQATNLPWVISADALEKELQIPEVHLINDLEANAWGIRCLSEREFFTINVGEEVKGNQAIISAGTGLGEAGLYWDGQSHQPFATEGGHSDFAPVNEEQIDLLRYLKLQYGHISYERILSGSGLYSLYRFLIDTQRESEIFCITSLFGQKEPQRVITENGVNGQCPACARACRLFISIYGSEAGNLALKFLSVGGVFLGGGIAPHLLNFFKEGKFIQSFSDKGRFSSLLMKIPIKVVLNEKTALIGAARYAQEK
ncbi:MAG: glucokinase [Rhabdochlamydiaceae bacterium]